MFQDRTWVNQVTEMVNQRQRVISLCISLYVYIYICYICIYIYTLFTNKKGTHHRDQSTQNWEQGPQALDLSSGGYFPGKHNL